MFEVGVEFGVEVVGEKKTKLMLYSTLVEIEVEVGVELGKKIGDRAPLSFSLDIEILKFLNLSHNTGAQIISVSISVLTFSIKTS